jgi:prephenate dehydratase
MHVVTQGEIGSFHHQAIEQWFGNDVDIIPANTFGNVFDALDRSEAGTAVVAVENSLYGSINEVLDLIETHHYPIIGEVYLRIEQQLIGLPKATLEKVTKIYSHPVALAQCEQYFDNHFPNAQRIEYHDTAASVECIKQLGDPSAVAVAGRAAAAYHHLPILAENIEDNKANFTRFLILSREQSSSQTTNKASIVLVADNAPGSLARALAQFATANINLTKLQSRPIVGTPWKYRFYIDLEASKEQLERIIAAIQKDDNTTITILGTYTAAWI